MRISGCMMNRPERCAAAEVCVAYSFISHSIQGCLLYIQTLSPGSAWRPGGNTLLWPAWRFKGKGPTFEGAAVGAHKLKNRAAASAEYDDQMMMMMRLVLLPLAAGANR